MDFWSENGSMLAPKSHQKSIPTSKSDFLKKPHFSLGINRILKVRGIEIEEKFNEKSIKK